MGEGEPGPEEGGEDIFYMPTHCVTWHGPKTNPNYPEYPPLVRDERGNMVCPVCGVSYGRAE